MCVCMCVWCAVCVVHVCVLPASSICHYLKKKKKELLFWHDCPLLCVGGDYLEKKEA